jgi:hypothetical protein
VKYLTSAVSASNVRDILKATDEVGVMVTPAGGRRVELIQMYSFWAADNGCFAAAFDLDAYLSLLADLRELAPACLFATAPDVVGDAKATLWRSKDVLPLIRRLGYPAAFVGQDGIEDLEIPWDSFDAWFTGGSTEWKLSERAYGLAAEARRRGKWTHLGRVNSFIRLKAAHVSGYDSADGTMLAFGPDKRAKQLLGWLDALKAQPAMELAL